MNALRTLLVLVLPLVLSGAAGADPQGPGKWGGLSFGGSSGHASAELFHRVEGDRVQVAIPIRIDPNWHLYHNDLGHPDAVGKPTTISFEGDGEVEWAPAIFPEAHKFDQPLWDAFVLAHEGSIVVYAKGTLAPGTELGGLRAVIDGLTCEDDGQCVPYAETVESGGSGSDALFASFPEEEEEEDQDDGLLAFLGLAVFWGLFTLLMPCTYPMIPITISFFTKQASDRKGSVLPLALAYGLGIVAIFILIGIVFGQVIIPFATNPWTNLVIGGLFLFFALVLFGVVNLQPPRFMLELAGKASRTGGLAGVFLMGATLVVTSFTCTAPFVGSLLSVGAQDGGVGRIAIGMGTFGLTMAVPFVLLSLVPGYMQRMPKSGEWMNTLKVFLGFVELAAAFKFISNSDLVWSWNVLSRELFLLVWAAIFVVGAVYLLGLLPGKRANPGPGRATVAFLALAFAGYCAWGMSGREMDRVMTAIIPNYSGGVLMPTWTDFDEPWTIAVDDYDEAVEIARSDGKLVLVNFTGHT